MNKYFWEKNKIFLLILLIFLISILLQINKKYIETYQDYILKFNKPKNWIDLNFSNKLKIYGQGLTKDYSLYSDKLRVKNI